MRIPAIAVGLALLCSSFASAQGIGWGVRGGVNVANVKTEGEGSSSTLNWHVRGVLGGFVTLPVTRWFELQPEVLYAMKGAQLQDSGIAARLLLDYLEVPVLGRLSRRVSDRIRLYAAGGPSFGLRVRAKTRAAFSGSTEEIDISEDVERYDLGVVAAGGLEMGSILVDGRYTLGLSDIDKDTSDSVKITTRAVSLTVGFRF